MNFKAPILYLIIGAFFVFTFKPLGYCIYYLANYEYVAEVLCVNKDKPKLNCNGKCYLKKQLAQQNDRPVEKPEIPFSYFKYFPLQKSDILNLKPQFFLQSKHQFDIASIFYKENLFKPEIPPPRQLFIPLE